MPIEYNQIVAVTAFILGAFSAAAVPSRANPNKVAMGVLALIMGSAAWVSWANGNTMTVGGLLFLAALSAGIFTTQQQNDAPIVIEDPDTPILMW